MNNRVIVRKLLLTTHIIASAGWLGSVGAFLALAIAGVIRSDPALVRAVYQGMDIVTQWVIIPTSIAALVSGFVMGLATPWGLFRHYWVAIKLVITVVAIGILLTHAEPIHALAAAMADDRPLPPGAPRVQIQMIMTAAGALLVLLFVTLLSVVKPRGLTRHGWRQQQRMAADEVPRL